MVVILGTAVIGGLVLVGTISKIQRLLHGYHAPARQEFAEEPIRREMQDVPVDGVLPFEVVPRLAKRLAAEARMELHLASRCEAEVIQLKEWLRRRLTEMDVRKCDQLEIIPVAMHLAYLETRAERLSRAMTLSPEYVSRLDRTNTRMWRYEYPSLAHWFGRLIVEPEVLPH